MKFNNFLKIFLKCFLLLQQNSLALVQILGGETTTIDEVPFIIQIFKNKQFICGGSLISDRYALTAVHCVKDFAKEQFDVKAGATKLTDEGVTATISGLFLPPGYNHETRHMDVGVILLSKPFRDIPKATACENKLHKGTPVQIFGWGMANRNFKVASTQIRKITVPVMDHTECVVARKRNARDSMFCKKSDRRGSQDSGTSCQLICESCRGNIPPLDAANKKVIRESEKLETASTINCIENEKLAVTASMFCTNSKKGSSYDGDSGGPVLCGNCLCGIVSWGFGIKCTSLVSVHTNLEFAWPFINEIIESKA